MMPGNWSERAASLLSRSSAVTDASSGVVGELRSRLNWRRSSARNRVMSPLEDGTMPSSGTEVRYATPSDRNSRTSRPVRSVRPVGRPPGGLRVSMGAPVTSRASTGVADGAARSGPLSSAMTPSQSSVLHVSSSSTANT